MAGDRLRSPSEQSKQLPKKHEGGLQSKSDARDVRRYLTVIQDARGYPAKGQEPAPPEGPAQPMIHSVVLADDFEDIAARYLAVVQALRQAATDLNNCETAFRKADEGTEATPPHCLQRDAANARDRVLKTLREHVGEND